jgi:hypothetical protein
VRQAIRVLKTPVTLIILLAILGYGAMWGLEHATMSMPTQTATCVATDVGKVLKPNRVTVRVLNGGTNGGLAKRTALYLRAYGFHVIYWNNSEEKVLNTVIVGNADSDPEVKLVQQFFTGSTTKGDSRADHVVDVILGDKDTSIKDPVFGIPVSGPVCLPPIATASESAIPTPSASPTATKKKGK